VRVVVFDGVCLFCTGWVRFVAQRDHRRRYRFATAQSGYGSRQLIAAGLEPESLQTIVLAAEGRYLKKSDAILEILRGLGGAWRFIGLLKLVPRAIRDTAYDLVARNRYAVRGKTDVCPIPPRELRDRFME